MAHFDYELLIKVIAMVIGFLGLVYQFRNLKLTNRSSIKTDLEILRMIEKSDPNYTIVQRSINASIQKIYGNNRQPKFIINNPREFFVGLIVSVGFGYWTYYLSSGGFSFWSLLTGLFALSGLGGLINGLEGKEKLTKQTK